MYSKNNLQRNTLITFDEVVFHAPTKHTLDARMIENSIIVAEERFIHPELDSLYDTIRNAKNVEVTEENLATLQPKMEDPVGLKVGDIVNAYEFLSLPLQKLWKEHLWKIVAEAVLCSALPEGWIQFGAEGAFHNSPPAGLMVTSGFTTPLISGVKYMGDKKLQDRIEPLMASMKNYICANLGSFAGYNSSKCPDCNNKSITKYGGIALGLYDEEENDECGSCGGGWL